MTMIVGIDYTTEGERTISELHFTTANTDPKYVTDYAKKFKAICEEVYTCEFDPNNVPFINTIVTEGCRL